MDDFLADLDAEERRGPACSVGQLLGELDEKRDPLAAALRAAIGKTYSSASIHRQLLKRGIRISETTLSRHRRGGCRCDV